MSGIDELIERIHAQMTLDGETEQEILSELHEHLEGAVEQALTESLTEAEALARSASHLGLEEQVGQALQAAHAGKGTGREPSPPAGLCHRCPGAVALSGRERLL